jgi:hypothetical protein
MDVWGVEVKSVNTLHYKHNLCKDKVREFNHIREENVIKIQFINFEDFKCIQIHLINANWEPIAYYQQYHNDGN